MATAQQNESDRRINKVALRLADYMGQEPRTVVTQISHRMVEGWTEIEANWRPEDVGFDETPEERAMYEERFAALGEAILRFADLFLLEGDI